jgi:hypothetical protein
MRRIVAVSRYLCEYLARWGRVTVSSCQSLLEWQRPIPDFGARNAGHMLMVNPYGLAIFAALAAACPDLPFCRGSYDQVLR